MAPASSFNSPGSLATKRLQKELLKANNSGLPEGITLVSDPATMDIRTWQLDVRVLDNDNPIYRGQTFRLEFRFSPSYPIEPPEVVFVKVEGENPQEYRPVPMHPHIYSNGIICLDLLSPQGWSPVQNVESVCMSLQSMLTGNSKPERPAGDADFVRMNRSQPRNIDFQFHDDTV